MKLILLIALAGVLAGQAVDPHSCRCEDVGNLEACLKACWENRQTERIAALEERVAKLEKRVTLLLKIALRDIEAGDNALRILEGPNTNIVEHNTFRNERVLANTPRTETYGPPHRDMYILEAREH